MGHFDCSILLPRSKITRLHGQFPSPARRLNAYQVSPPILILHGPELSPILEIHLLRGLSSLASLGAAELLSGGILLRALGAADSADASDGLLAEVSAVTLLGGLVGNSLVDPIKGIYQQCKGVGWIETSPYLRLELLGP